MKPNRKTRRPPRLPATSPRREPAEATAVRPETTAAMRAWIRERFESGGSVPALIQRLVADGWSDYDARCALRDVLCDNDAPPVHAPPPERPLPGPADLSQTCIALDRPVRILCSLHHPSIVVFGNLLGDDECDALIELALVRMQRSRTVNEAGEQIVHSARTSRGTFFAPGATPLLARIEQRIAQLLQWPLENGEGMQVLCYDPGAEYKPHYDYFLPGPGLSAILGRGGQRVASLVIYLDEPESGGATVFPDVGLSVTPQRGNAVFFRYPQATAASLTLHGGAPVITGRKWVATKWLREGRFT